MRKPASPYNLDDPALMQLFDELPLWSAPFGMALLEQVKFKSGMRVLDLGCGTGFPLLELAQRLGDSCRVFGIDPWTVAIESARSKASQMQVTNVEIVEGRAEHMPFPDEYFEAVVSNNGINNVDDAQQALAECYRVCKAGGQLVLTVNLPDTMKEFYEVYEMTLQQLGKVDEVQRLRQHIFEKRKPLSTTTQMVIDAGFTIKQVDEESFSMRFLNGTSLLNHFS